MTTNLIKGMVAAKPQYYTAPEILAEKLFVAVMNFRAFDSTQEQDSQLTLLLDNLHVAGYGKGDLFPYLIESGAVVGLADRDAALALRDWAEAQPPITDPDTLSSASLLNVFIYPTDTHLTVNISAKYDPDALKITRIALFHVPLSTAKECSDEELEQHFAASPYYECTSVGDEEKYSTLTLTGLTPAEAMDVQRILLQIDPAEEGYVYAASYIDGSFNVVLQPDSSNTMSVRRAEGTGMWDMRVDVTADDMRVVVRRATPARQCLRIYTLNTMNSTGEEFETFTGAVGCLGDDQCGREAVDFRLQGLKGLTVIVRSCTPILYACAMDADNLSSGGRLKS